MFIHNQLDQYDIALHIEKPFKMQLCRYTYKGQSFPFFSFGGRPTPQLLEL